MKLDRQRILDAALQLLDEGGIDRLTTRALAGRLGVQQPALYWHFRNKRELLDAMNREILAHGHTRHTPAPGEPWEDFVRENARSFRRALLAYRDGARVHAGTEAQAQDLPQLEAQCALLVAAGMSPPQAMELFVAIGRYTIGCVLEEQAEAEESPAARQQALDKAAAPYPLLSQAIAHYRRHGHEALFEAGLQLLIDGARARLTAAAPPRRRARPPR
ncbi:transcriptional regulator [Frateuria sp. Soil773]|uniref:tetracycline resistance transcriptional repressor TetR n=1 Tax=Frateuria sp. Soil773 TaxID=1736407 RepID=UPI0006FBAA77|nr:tetracycline resistance transcriptional repressor TetR [Frateuria sp. Soil773]KRE89670.1 transcriptional regulator [Frateuria sp. Soil773]